jgi:hypothetical protein
MWWTNGLMNGCGETYVVYTLQWHSSLNCRSRQQLTTTPQPTIPVKPDTKNASYTNGDGSYTSPEASAFDFNKLR